LVVLIAGTLVVVATIFNLFTPLHKLTR